MYLCPEVKSLRCFFFKARITRVLVTLHDITCGKVIPVSQLLSVCNPLDTKLDRSS